MTKPEPEYIGAGSHLASIPLQKLVERSRREMEIRPQTSGECRAIFIRKDTPVFSNGARPKTPFVSVDVSVSYERSTVR